MTPLFACFPVCMTFVALGILAVLVIATGVVGPGSGADPDPLDTAAPEPNYGTTGPPRWWVVVLIFAAVVVVFLLLNWAAADSKPQGIAGYFSNFARSSLIASAQIW